MSQFNDFNGENKLRIPLSAYAANIIDSDCNNFFKKRTTLINLIIVNYYRQADCSISLRLNEYKKEIAEYLGKTEFQKNDAIVKRLLSGRAIELTKKYAVKHSSDVNWQITLNKKVKDLLTNDPYSQEEAYYGNKPGHYIRSLIEEYARLPFYMREELIFKQTLDMINAAISGSYAINVTNIYGTHFSLKPYKISADSMFLYHYVLGHRTVPYSPSSNSSNESVSDVLGMRLSRITDVEIQYGQPDKLSTAEEQRILKALEEKGIQFISSETIPTKIWLSDLGIKTYNSKLHLRPFGVVDESDKHIYYFECTETQILYYFIGFASEAKILSPPTLAEKFKSEYEKAADNYK